MRNIPLIGTCQHRSLVALITDQLKARQFAHRMSIIHESMPFSSSSPISNLSLASTTHSSGLVASVTSSAPTPVASVSIGSLVTEYLATKTVTASIPSSPGLYYNSSSSSSSVIASGRTSTISSSAPAGGMMVSTADFTSGQSLPTSLVLATSYTNSTGQGAMPTSTYTSWDVVGGSASGSTSTIDVGGTALASPQNRPSGAVRQAVKVKPSFLALGVLVLGLVLIG